MIKREQRLLADSAERSNFTESKVNPIINHVKIKTVSHTWLRSSVESIPLVFSPHPKSQFTASTQLMV